MTPSATSPGTFARLPQPAQALLVRMVMRKGELFRTARLGYAEIGDPAAALAPLVEAGLVEDDPALSLADLFRLLRLAELRRLLAEEMATLGLAASASKGCCRPRLRPSWHRCGGCPSGGRRRRGCSKVSSWSGCGSKRTATGCG
ncbi:hypothetical protein [Halomonas sp. E19]|uniref:hypothetical protein n=1 Tax=Halomonas sp. E19 TaxID=3397247 RepID=UPI0040340F55